MNDDEIPCIWNKILSVISIINLITIIYFLLKKLAI
jgi:hypothetical protein